MFWGNGVKKKAEGQPEGTIVIDSPECFTKRFAVDLTVKKIHCNSLNQGRGHQSGVWGCSIFQAELKALEQGFWASPSWPLSLEKPASFSVNFSLQSCFLWLSAMTTCIGIHTSKRSFLLKHNPHWSSFHMTKRNITSSTLPSYILAWS